MDWKDISISKYLKINDIIEDVNIIDEDKMIEIANIIFNEDITELPLYECKKKIKELSFINTEAPKEKLAKQYVVNDTKYNSSADVTSI